MPARAVEPWKITGLKEFQAGLKEFEDGLQKELRVVFNAAAETVAVAARRKVPTSTGRAAASVKAQSGQREAKIIGGSAKVPYFGFLDYGGKVGIGRSVSRPFRPAGRYVYPAFAAHRDQFGRDVAAGLVDLARRAGLDMDAGL